MKHLFTLLLVIFYTCTGVAASAQNPTDEEPGDPAFAQPFTVQKTQAFPNPTNGRVNLAFNYEAGKYLVKVTSIKGNIIYQNPLPANHTQGFISFDLPAHSGMVIISLQKDNDIIFSKLLIIK